MCKGSVWIGAGLVAMALVCGFPHPAGVAVHAQPRIDWTHYHTYAEMTQILEAFVERYPKLAKLYSIGKSFQGKDLWCLEITNTATGAPETKPGAYIDGNTHAGEVSGAQAALYLINHLLTSYGKDERVTRLVDTRVFYILPKINPDGSDQYLRDPRQPPDPNLKPVDDDGDGAGDEDGPEDLNKDGIISVMRVRDERGPLRTSPKDPRLMVPRRIDETGEWRIIGPEGIDNDNDGRINEDPPGSARTVTNRNYPAYWQPEWVQSGAGPYPLSEPEAKAQVDFILAHPNIAGVQAYHTHSGVLLRPYTSLSDEHLPAADLSNFEAVGKLGRQITGYAFMSLYHGFTPDKSQPRRGIFVDWAYDHFGAFVISTEIWKAPGEMGESAFDGVDEQVAMEWNDRELGGAGFINWEPYDHPQFGKAEIGGWNGNYFSQNPPPRFAEAEWKKQCEFEILRAGLLPYLRIVDEQVQPLGGDLVKLMITVENQGFLPTNVTQIAIDHKLASSVRATVEVANGDLVAGQASVDLGHIAGNGPGATSQLGTLQPTQYRNRATAEWLIRTKGAGGTATVTVKSQKAGTATARVSLK